ncbi:MAG TPA: hydantoinase/oxoprolinase family protein [Candidatus Marinimicrobia bacterium]|jgi:N-methylhydantoinase A|nr:hydantoinase/oxoprolinase family protein [Candidatus Neomarinimicrobiota bacterium]
MKYKLGVDIGGTFTDFFLVSNDGEAVMHKTLSTPEDSSIGFITGIKELAEKLSIDEDKFIQSIETIVHGTTVATNTLLTLKGAKTALITTKGMRDALEMRRGIREEQYNNHYQNVTPLVPRYLRLTIDERIDADGNVETPVNESELEDIIEKLKSERVESVAVCLMNSYLNDTHEKQVTEYFRSQLTDVYITASCEVLPSIRFYERVSTTVVNAYIGVVVDKYIASLLEKLDAHNFKGGFSIMQSNGGVVSPEVVRKIPAVTVLSGPAAAPIAGAFYADLLGFDNCITMDMGGTSFDTSMVVNGQCVTSTDGDINRYRIALPSLDIITIGAGGGSIGWVDNGGLLQMGPQSAGSLPGPVCYDREGEEPACTDADLLLGYLDADFFAGGKYKLNKNKASKELEKKLTIPLDLSIIETAAGMYRVINMNMAQGVRQVSVERGYDPREFLMIVAGGAGPIHAGEICRELEIPMFVVPNVASIFCATGMLLGDLKHDYVRSYITRFSHIDKTFFLNLYDEMKQESLDTLAQEGISDNQTEFLPTLDLRYVGQYHEVPLQVNMDDIFSFNLDKIKKEFHREHNRQFGYSLEEEGTELEIINVRLRAIGVTEKPNSFAKMDESDPVKNPDFALKSKREAYVPELDELKEIHVYDGDKLTGKYTIEGPAIIEQINTTIFLGETYDCDTGIGGSFIVYNREKYPDGFDIAMQN